MSYLKDVYTGVYIECKNELIFKFKCTKICSNKCSNKEYDVDMDFCPKCGKRLKEIKIKNGLQHKIEFEIPDELIDIMIDINAGGLKIDKDIYINNSDVGRVCVEELSDIKVFEIYNLNGIIDYNKFVFIKQIDDFLKDDACYSFLQLCINAYKVENVSLKFGTIIYYS
jgi:hypothetical protein